MRTHFSASGLAWTLSGGSSHTARACALSPGHTCGLTDKGLAEKMLWVSKLHGFSSSVTPSLSPKQSAGPSPHHCCFDGGSTCFCIRPTRKGNTDNGAQGSLHGSVRLDALYLTAEGCCVRNPIIKVPPRNCSLMEEGYGNSHSFWGEEWLRWGTAYGILMNE